MTHEEFSLFVGKYERLVFTICYRLTKDYDISQNLAQDTFLSAYTHLLTKKIENEKPWIARIATNKAKDYLKSAYNKKVQLADEESFGAIPSPDMGPEELTVSEDGAGRIRECILSLKEPYHKVSVLYFIEEKSIEEISFLLGRPPKTVRTQVYRARQMIQNSLLKEVVR